jgi:phospholipid/cholesterol/gamma-HCH transport system substrate-binding protein
VTLLKRLLLAVPALALVLGTLSCSAPFHSDRMTITAYFPDSAGLFVGNDVGVLGVPVGRVDSIQPDGAQVKVTLSVNADQPVPANAGAVIVARSVATDRYVELTPVYTSGARMGDGAVIPAARTQTPVDFDEVLDSLNSLATGLTDTPKARDAVKRLVDAADAALGDKGGLLHDTITSVAGATDTLAGQRQQLVDTLTALDGVVQVIDKNQRTESTFLREVRQGSQLLAGQRTQFQAALDSLDRVVTDLADFNTRNGGRITRTLTHANTLMQTLVTNEGSLGQDLQVLPLALQNVARADHNHTLPVRLDPLVLLPLGNVLQSVCGLLPGNLCELLDGTGTLVNLLNTLLGGKL